MSENLYSVSWYRVAGLRPRLSSHVCVHRHRYRGQVWYVLENRVSEKLYRFAPNVYTLIGYMDGSHTVQELWDLASEKLGDNAPSQDQTIQVLGQLYAADVLKCDASPDTAEIMRRHSDQSRRKWIQQLLSPLFWRIPLVDPDRFLSRLTPLVRPLFGTPAFLLWLAVVILGLTSVCVYWQDLTENLADRVLTPQNLLILWLLFPVFKAVHEFGHAFSVKVFGGEVHEMGISFLVLTPVPYVDASAASAFREKRHRILVGAAGMMVEIFIASLALFLWLNVEPSTLRSILYNIVFMVGVSTVLFNINPLLKFDGYYILCDVVEIPNLWSRSRQYLSYLIQRYCFGVTDSRCNATAEGERAWFVVYSLASCTYRIFILSTIILFIAGKFFFVGVALAVWGVFAWGVLPLVYGVQYLLTSPRLMSVRGRAIAVSLGAALTVVSLLCYVPAPMCTLLEGVVWVPEEAVVRAGTDGFIVRIAARPGKKVQPGDPLFICEDPASVTRVQVVESQIRELQARKDQALLKEPVEAKQFEEKIDYLEKILASERERIDKLTIRSRTDGILVIPDFDDLPERFVRKGEALAHIVNQKTVTVRIVVAQEDIDLVRHRTREVRLCPVGKLNDPILATIAREVPTASTRLPTSVLGTQGGGRIATDPYDEEGTTTFHKFFQLDLRLLSPGYLAKVGSRVFVRLDHGWEPLARRWYRRVRRLFLKKFDA